MTRILLEASKGGTLEILPDGDANRFYLLLATAPPHSVHLLHVFWSGEALFFLHDFHTPPTHEEMTEKLEPGSVAWVPNLGEVVIAYGTAAPRDQHGKITVARLGRIPEVTVLREVGRRVWLHGAEEARLVVTPSEPAMNGKKHLYQT